MVESCPAFVAFAPPTHSPDKDRGTEISAASINAVKRLAVFFARTFKPFFNEI
jgi:hypothetical protein